jgi:hypothetical protein
MKYLLLVLATLSSLTSAGTSGPMKITTPMLPLRYGNSVVTPWTPVYYGPLVARQGCEPDQSCGNHHQAVSV